MPGRVLRILDKNTYSYASTQIPGGQSISFPIALNVDISQFPYQELVARLHAVTWGAGSSFNITAYNSSVSEDDPALLFRGSTPLISATLTNGTETAPGLKVGAAVAGAAGAAFDIVVTITMATVAQAISFVVSADLVLKS